MVSIEEQLNYIINLNYIYISSEKDYNKVNKNIYSLDLYCRTKLINKLTNTLIKLISYYNTYLNNLPLNLKYLFCNKVNCNLTPNIIYLESYMCDVNNLPRSLQFINNGKFIIPKELIIDYHYDKNKVKFIDYYLENIIKLNSIY